MANERQTAGNPFGVSGNARAAGQRVAGARYQLKRMLGRGSFSEVWLARSRTREEDVALKFLPQSLLQNAALISHLQQEILRAVKLTHPAVVQVYDFVQDNQNVAVAMEYVDGWSLAALKVDRAQKRYTIEEIRPWLRQLGAALEQAHRELGLVHGDLKPANLLLDAREQLKVTDFGITHIVRRGLALTGPALQRALPYMSPQQAQGDPASFLDDVYSLGATIYDLLTGTPPFFKGEIMAQVCDTPPPPMTGRLVQLELEGAFPEIWDRTIAACLAKAPAQRPRSIAQVLESLELLQTLTEPAQASPAQTKAPADVVTQPTEAPVVAAAQPAAALSPAPTQPPIEQPKPSKTERPAASPTPEEALAKIQLATPSEAPALVSSSSTEPTNLLEKAPADESSPPPILASKRNPALIVAIAVLSVVALAGLLWLALSLRHARLDTNESAQLNQKSGPPGSLDTSFNPGAGADNDIRSLAVQPDGKLLVGGRFSYFDDSNLRGIARLNPDGTPERTFAPGANGAVHAIALQPDGKIILGGDFGRVGGQPRRCLARLEADGSLDTAFNPRGVFNHEVRAVLLQRDGKVLVGGSFNANRQNRLIRLNSDGTKDASFDSGGANRMVWTLALQKDGKILVGGSFSSFDDHPQGRLVRLNPDGSVDATFACGSGADQPILALAVQPDAKILVAGDFTMLDGAARPHIARLLPDGTADNSFNPGAGPDKSVRSLAIQSDGKVVIAGTFRNVAGAPRNNIARLNADGSLDQPFNPGEVVGGGAWQASLQADGKVLVVGGFTNFNGAACGRIARLYAK